MDEVEIPIAEYTGRFRRLGWEEEYTVKSTGRDCIGPCSFLALTAIVERSVSSSENAGEVITVPPAPLNQRTVRN